MFCLQWCPLVWPFQTKAPASASRPRTATLAKFDFSKPEQYANSFQGQLCWRSDSTRSEKQNLRAVALSRRGVGGGGGGGGGGWRRTCQSSRSVRRAGRLPRARGCGVAAAASLSGDLAVVFIDSLCRSAAESRPAAPAPANQSTLNLLICIITEERRALSHQNFCFARQFLSAFGGGRLQARKLGYDLSQERQLFEYGKLRLSPRDRGENSEQKCLGVGSDPSLHTHTHTHTDTHACAQRFARRRHRILTLPEHGKLTHLDVPGPPPSPQHPTPPNPPPADQRLRSPPRSAPPLSSPCPAPQSSSPPKWTQSAACQALKPEMPCCDWLTSLR